VRSGAEGVVGVVAVDLAPVVHEAAAFPPGDGCASPTRG
tara:strand:+ start:639 stop:755 length:117 start_codon:yes stop_codon:yes gene_type:complete